MLSAERVFALISASIEARSGDVEAGLLDAVGWLAENVPIYSVNLLLSTATDLWALRYPEPDQLYLLDRREATPAKRFDLRTPRIHARSDELDQHPCVVFASEAMDGDPRWKLLDSGVLVHVDEQLLISEREAFPDAPKHQLTVADLSPKASASQHTSVRQRYRYQLPHDCARDTRFETSRVLCTPCGRDSGSKTRAARGTHPAAQRAVAVYRVAHLTVARVNIVSPVRRKHVSYRTAIR